MAKRWKRWKNSNNIQEPPQEIDRTKMIEHSINKYPTYTPFVNNIIPLPNSRVIYGYETWNKLQCENYVKLLNSRGYVAGTPIITKWGIPGVIDGFKEIRDEGWSFSGQPTPNCITIRRNDVIQNQIFYSEDELTLVKELQQ